LPQIPQKVESDLNCCGVHDWLVPPRTRSRRPKALPNDAANLGPLMRQLFDLQDLDANGLLAEDDMILINQALAFLHKGSHSDMGKVQALYRDLFRTELDPDGKPVP